MRTRLLLLAVLAACGDDPGSDIPEACNPLGGQGCMLPWPSMAYIEADGSAANPGVGWSGMPSTSFAVLRIATA